MLSVSITNNLVVLRSVWFRVKHQVKVYIKSAVGIVIQCIKYCPNNNNALKQLFNSVELMSHLTQIWSATILILVKSFKKGLYVVFIKITFQLIHFLLPICERVVSSHKNEPHACFLSPLDQPLCCVLCEENQVRFSACVVPSYLAYWF